MRDVIRYFGKGSDYQNVLNALQKGMNEQLIAGLSGSTRSLFMSALYVDTERTQLVVTHNLHHAQKLYDDMVEWLGDEHVLLYPVNESLSAEVATASPELRQARIRVLNALVRHKKCVLIVPLAALKRLLPPRSLWASSQRTICLGDEMDIHALQQQLLIYGYNRVDMVESPGEYSIRGGIVDVFAVDHEDPLRIELFDTEVDSIRTFDVENQKSKQQLDETTIGPGAEWLLDTEDFRRGAERADDYLQQQLARMQDDNARQLLIEKVGSEIEQLREGQHVDGMYKYIRCLYEEPATIVNYLAHDFIVLFDEPSRLLETEETAQQEEQEWQKAMIEAGEYVPEFGTSITLDEWRQRIHAPLFHMSLFLRQTPNTNPQNIVNFTARPMQNFHGQFSVMETEMARWKKSGQVVLLTASDEERAKRMVRVLRDFKMDARLHEDGEALVPGTPLVKIGRIQSGFELPLHHMTVITENEVFTKQKKKARRSKKISNAQRIQNYNELSTGDYVVHINHGIGKYLGIKTMEIDGIHKDYLHVQYAGNDNLYVPVEQIDQVQKYVGSGDSEPKLYTLGGNEWKRVKRKVKSSVEDIAADLIKLYAKREATKGHAFSKDTELHREFASLFPYQETEDQRKSIDEITVDMERERPMDRLLCGDVGYGKTEVAIRAAFKAIMDGKQVAVLVPTTILAQQHYETFRERFHDFPVEIEVLSRFRSRKEQNQTVKNMKSGVVDIVIGTHRLLSKDITFKDLGLLVVDEEQRFGVTHKEKIKQMRANVDVLTLTATPIPRTLHMSMLGVRDLSVIETPPENRFPVQTYVVEYNGAMLREAIERELDRGGQVYFLYNHVQGIERKAEEIRALVPDARVAVAHGQMKESELEAIMIDFLEGEYDVLVSTTIIETGVDIPNVNTLIIYNADRMGLSQLYQLRGRVGRSNRTAYAYFTYQRGKVLSEVAEKRLESIKEFTELGSGFKIAMRDLAIRGAGNLLGAEQSGFIHSVGFDLYTQMLQDAIEKLKGEKPVEEEPIETEVNIPLDAYIPDTYIGDSTQKIEMYKKAAGVTSIEEIDGLIDECQDRFGPLPNAVHRLFQVTKFNVYARRLSVRTLEKKEHTLRILFDTSQNDKIDVRKLVQVVGRFGRHVGLISGEQLGLSMNVRGRTETDWLAELEQLFADLVAVNIYKGDERIEEQKTASM